METFETPWLFSLTRSVKSPNADWSAVESCIYRNTSDRFSNHRRALIFDMKKFLQDKRKSINQSIDKMYGKMHKGSIDFGIFLESDALLWQRWYYFLTSLLGTQYQGNYFGNRPISTPATEWESLKKYEAEVPGIINLRNLHLRSTSSFYVKWHSLILF